MSDLQNQMNLQQIANEAAANNVPMAGNMSSVVNEPGPSAPVYYRKPDEVIQPNAAPANSASNAAPVAPVQDEPQIFMAAPPPMNDDREVSNFGHQEIAPARQGLNPVPPAPESYMQEAPSEVDVETQKAMLLKELIQNGMPVDEAKKQVDERFSAPKEEENEESDEAEESEESSVYEIQGSASQLDKIELPDDVRQKAFNSKVIKLTEVVDKDLKNIKVKKYTRTEKISALRHLTNAISRYSVPLPSLGEYATFGGAQTIDLVTNLTNDDDSPVETLEKTTAMLYDKFISGTVTDKFDENGDNVMGINEFMKTYRYNDMYYGLFGIFCASVKEEIESELGCPDCNKSFKIKYNIQSLLDLNDVSDKYKEKITTIIANKSNSRVIGDLVKQSTETSRYQSPESGIIFDMSQPSISKAMRILSFIDPEDRMQSYNAVALMYVDTIYVPDPSTGEWVLYGIDEEIEEDLAVNANAHPDYEPIAELFDIIQELTQADRNLIGDIINKEYLFGVSFVLHSKCPHCGKKLRNNLDIRDMVFQVARGLSVSTKL